MQIWFRRLLVIGLVGFGLLTIARIVFAFQLIDFGIYYQGARSALFGGDPYSVVGVIYPPLSLILLSPFAVLPYWLAEDMWTIGSAVALLGSIVLLLRSTKAIVSIEQVATLFGLALFTFPCKFTLGMGQINLYLLFLLCLTFFWHRQGKPWSAGFALALAATLKVTPVLLLLFFVRKQQCAASASFAISFLALQFAGIVLLGFSTTQHYWLRIFPSIAVVGNSTYYNQSVTGWFARIGADYTISKLVLYGALVLLTVIVWRSVSALRQSGTIELLEFGLVSLILLLGTGLVWQHHYVLALIPFAGITLNLNQLGRRKKIVAMVSLVACFGLIAWNIKAPSLFMAQPFALLLSHVFYGGIGLFCLTWYLLQQRKG